MGMAKGHFRVHYSLQILQLIQVALADDKESNKCNEKTDDAQVLHPEGDALAVVDLSTDHDNCTKGGVAQ